MQLVGELGGLDADARSQLRLREGDSFDFYRWQQDRDDLERFYSDRGFLQARIRPHRTESGDGTVTLTYDIARGPLSLLTIEGYELPDDMIRRMRDAWTRAVFDGFLLDELRALAREHMGSRGFLQAEIGAEVLDGSDADRKEIVLRIAEGPRTSERRIAFRGNEEVTTAELKSFMDRQTVTTSIWADPDPLTRSLLALYQSKGMLEAQIIVEPPEFDTDTATLPVRVVEGAVFTICERLGRGSRHSAGGRRSGARRCTGRRRLLGDRPLRRPDTRRPELPPGGIQPRQGVGPVDGGSGC